MMKNNRLSNFILSLMLLAGLSLLLYPSFSDYWNSSRQTQVITHYAEAVANLDDASYGHILDSAREYNATLVDRFNGYLLDETQQARYPRELNLSGDGVMAYVEIPSINVLLPIHHGISEEVLQVAVGHIDWSSLPVGGESTHCVISGHRGLPSAKLFTDLDRLVVGDIFIINVLNQVLTYEVDQIKIVLPHETEELLIQEGQDYCTLVTCTPYGVNSHRMLVRGRRIANLEEERVVRVTADAVQIEPLIVAPFVAAPILLILLIVLLIPSGKKRRKS